MTKYQKISEARNLLELPEQATLKEIKANYKSLLYKWHPDKCDEKKDKCHEMTQKIIDAYKTIMNYCNQYKYSFSKEEVKKYLSEGEWWLERFGGDSVWGDNNE
jgi:DnaJ-class molecular chaperone